MSQVERATRDYWWVSLAYNKRPKASNVSVTKAMKILNTHIEFLPIHRPIYGLTVLLLNDIIHGKSKQRKSK